MNAVFTWHEQNKQNTCRHQWNPDLHVSGDCLAARSSWRHHRFSTRNCIFSEANGLHLSANALGKGRAIEQIAVVITRDDGTVDQSTIVLNEVPDHSRDLA